MVCHPGVRHGWEYDEDEKEGTEPFLGAAVIVVHHCYSYIYLFYSKWRTVLKCALLLNVNSIFSAKKHKRHTHQLRQPVMGN